MNNWVKKLFRRLTTPIRTSPPAESLRRSSFSPCLESLEGREVPATLQAIGGAFASSLAAYARTDVVAPTLRAVPESIQKSIVADAADDLESAYDASLRRAAEFGTTLARTGAVPPLAVGYKIALNPVNRSGPVGRISYEGKTSYTDRAVIADGHSGYYHFDRQFGGDLHGTADVRAAITTRWSVDVYEGPGGKLTAKVGDGSFSELSGVQATDALGGRGMYAALPDVTLSGRGTVTGRATFKLVDLPGGGVRALADFDLPSNFVTTVVSNDTFSKGVTWSINDATRLAAGSDLKQPAPVFTAPSAVSLLRAAVNGLNTFRVNLPDGMASAIQSALAVKVPFTGKTVGETIGFPNFVPLAVNTINPNAYATFTQLADAINKDKRFSVLLTGETGALQFARGQLTDVLSIRVKADASKSFKLAGADGTYVLFPGVTLKGGAAVSVELKGSVDGLLKLDSHGLGVREGMSAKVELKIGGALSGSLSVLEIGKLFSLFSANAKVGAYVEGSVTATLGRPADKDGKPTGSGALYLGAGAAYNPKRPASDFVRVDTDLEAGVEASTKVRVFGITVYKKDWDKSWSLAHSTRLPAAPLS